MTMSFQKRLIGTSLVYDENNAAEISIDVDEYDCYFAE